MMMKLLQILRHVANVMAVIVATKVSFFFCLPKLRTDLNLFSCILFFLICGKATATAKKTQLTTLCCCSSGSSTTLTKTTCTNNNNKYNNNHNNNVATNVGDIHNWFHVLPYNANVPHAFQCNANINSCHRNCNSIWYVWAKETPNSWE